jgi:RNA polymerase sigma factor (sigma-70 family)
MTRYQQLSEVEIITSVINGDNAAFEVLIRRYNPYLYKIGRTYGYTHEDVQDLMQDTLISAYRNLAKLENKGYFKTWLSRIMLNECFKKKHQETSERERMVAIYSNDKAAYMVTNNNHSDTEARVKNRELSKVIEKAINKIPIDYRLVFSLRELNAMSVAETASALNISEVNVKVRLNRAKAMLRREIENLYTPEDIFEFNLVYCDAIVGRVMREIVDR